MAAGIGRNSDAGAIGWALWPVKNARISMARRDFLDSAGRNAHLTGEACANQAFVIGASLGMQCHIEMTPDMVQDGAGLEHRGCWDFQAAWKHRGRLQLASRT